MQKKLANNINYNNMSDERLIEILKNNLNKEERLKIKEILLKRYEKLIYYLVNSNIKYTKYTDKEDLIQYGYYYFFDLVNKYKRQYNLSFKTYLFHNLDGYLKYIVRKSNNQYKKEFLYNDYLYYDNNENNSHLLLKKDSINDILDKNIENIYFKNLDNRLRNILNEKQYKCLIARYVYNFSSGEIAKKFNVPKQEIYQLMYLTRKKLKKYFKK